ncbi:type I polyketide synthase [Chania multitudinisentens]|uniref:type I polyketide synthase n=1 Tax=Chania multitudinisentens TaxID=1639108 RepID=UPI0003E14374|nr:type I polyketide synthase [Chania multitudinisentens]
MNSIRNYILQQVAKQQLNQQQAKAYLMELNDLDRTATADNDIAIIGMAGRFPKAENAEVFWQLLRDGINCIDEYPLERRKDDAHILSNPHYMEYLNGRSLKPDEIADAYAKAGYMQETDKFDAAFFGIPPAEALYMDPNQRLTLEVAWEAIEDSGYGGEKLFGSNTGVFVGREGTNHALYRYQTKSDPMQLTGSWESIIGSRISYLFNFRGPCMLVDTACSSSLVSIHMAAQSINNGECDIALAGGVNIIPGEFKTRYQGGMSMDSVESGDSVIRTFDANANGTVWGEGVAIVLLKPLRKALQDGDLIHAVIKGSAINNDGASGGLTAPNAEAQEAVIVKAWENAGINPESLSYIEAHGTGTVLGDPIEFKGLTNAFRRYTNRNQFCAIGSLKTNMGHLVATSGAASLFKVVKSMKYRYLAPTINFNQPNPYINFASSPLFIADRLQAWEFDSGPRRAAINSFGFSHTNCHMVLEEAPAREQVSGTRPQYCFTLSAKKQSLLLDYVSRYQEFCRSQPWNLADLCFTAATGRGHYGHRLAIVADSEAQLQERLRRCAETIQHGDDRHEGIYYAAHTVVSEKKKQRAAGEITDKEKKNLSAQAAQSLAGYRQHDALPGLLQLAHEYSLGAEVDWESVFADERRIRLSQPTYPFERVRVWAEPKASKAQTFVSRLHPLVERRVVHHDDEWVYESEFNSETHWILADHQIKGVCVVPGTTYLEMLRSAAGDALGLTALELVDLVFLQPMVVAEGETRTVRVHLSRGNGDVSCRIASMNEADGETVWSQHVEGKIRPLEETALPPLDFATLQAQADEVDEQYQLECDTGVFQFGPHWDCIRKTWSSPACMLAQLELPALFQQELGDIAIHPSMLDNAMNLTSQNSGQTYLPFMYQSFRLHRRFTPLMYVCVRARTPISGTEETHTYDVILADPQGNIIAEAESYITKKLHHFDFVSARAAENHSLGMRWVPLETPEPENLPAGPLLLLATDTQSTASLVAAVQSQGIEVRTACLSVAAQEGEDNVFTADNAGMTALLASSVAQNIAGIILATDYLQAESERYYCADAVSFERQRSLGVNALFYLGQALTMAKYKLSWGLGLLSSAAYAVNRGEQPYNPLAAASAMLGLTLALETPGLNCRVLDTGEAIAAERVIRNLLLLPTGQIYALRGEALYQREMYTHAPDDEAEWHYRQQGVYLITGGLGGLGLAAARHLAECAKANIILLGRSTLPDPVQWRTLLSQHPGSKRSVMLGELLQLQEKAASLTYLQVDVADLAALSQALEQVRAQFGRIDGVLHAAGAAGDGFIMRKSFATFDSVLRPKLEGSRNLVSLLANDDLDFMAFYSSITALTGGQGQGDYAAANAFMDALVPMVGNLRAIAINWPAWRDVGMAVDYQLDDNQTPFASLSNQEAFARLGQILASGSTQTLPGTINPGVFVEMRPWLPFTLAVELNQQLQRAQPQAGMSLSGEIEEIKITGKSADELSTTETSLATIYSSVLGISEIDIFTNFQDMGGNSIIAIHLLKVIESHYPGTVDIADVFSYPAVDVMAEYIDQKHGRTPAATVQMAPEQSVEWESIIERMIDGEESIDSIVERF